ncbi:TPA: hypothetical protein QBQ18_005822 [Pseudomonas aeruginosa]|nr:hypothetical protein [Pseudomonas aeruginosa]HDQ9774675.1 hypothetical protein [Pseudomonas aeruginosa]
MRRGLWMIFRWPLLLALLGLFGLLSWLALGTPLVLVGWVWLRLPRTRRNP